MRPLICAISTVLCLAATLMAEPVVVDPPMTVQVHLRGASAVVAGKLTTYDDTIATIQTRDGQRDIRWIDMTGPSAYALRARLIDKTKAQDWLVLGSFGWKLGVTDARYALNKAATMDSSLKPQVDAVLASKPGEWLTSPEKPSVEPAPTTVKDAGSDAPTKYQPATPEQAAAAIDKSRADAAKIQKQLRLPLQEIQTEHFLIFTDWDPREIDFLKTNLEGAYALVSRQFDLPASENIFIGKLPVYMLSTRETFRLFSREVDNVPEMGERASGYYAGRSDGVGHMVMWKPDVAANGGNLAKARERWAYVLTHEFTHAFVARYRNNRHIPSWLNEGIAEMIAASAFPNPWAIAIAQRQARNGTDIREVFENPGLKDGQLYPVMRTLVEMLVRENPRAFREMFDAIKDGTPAEEALQKYYKVDYTGLTNAWRRWVVTLRTTMYAE